MFRDLKLIVEAVDEMQHLQEPLSNVTGKQSNGNLKSQGGLFSGFRCGGTAEMNAEHPVFRMPL